MSHRTKSFKIGDIVHDKKESIIAVENQFPLFNILLAECQTKTDYPSQQVKELATKIKSLDKQGQEIAYALIRVYSLRFNNIKVLDIPYQGKKIDEKVSGNDLLHDISIDLKLLPSPLKYMLEKFYHLHTTAVPLADSDGSAQPRP